LTSLAFEQREVRGGKLPGQPYLLNIGRGKYSVQQVKWTLESGGGGRAFMGS